MWMNLPIAILLVAGLRVLLNEVDFSWKTRNVRPQTYLSHLGKKQLSVNDSRLSTPLPLPKWKSKVDSPLVEAAMEDFIQKILHDFVIDLWYSEITPDKEVPQLIHSVIMDVLGEISLRAKQINLFDLLTRYFYLFIYFILLHPVELKDLCFIPSFAKGLSVDIFIFVILSPFFQIIKGCSGPNRRPLGSFPKKPGLYWCGCHGNSVFRRKGREVETPFTCLPGTSSCSDISRV